MAKIGKCGDDCEYCPRYTATQNNNAAELNRVKDLYVKLGLRDPDFPAEEMVCRGCQPENKCAYPELAACLDSKAMDNCGCCPSYPCSLIVRVFDKSDQFKYMAEKICTKEEMHRLNNAFFSKREYFNKIHQNFKK